MCPSFLFAALCSVTGFVLAMLGLFAGNTPGFMEECQVVLLNTSALGRNHVPNLNLPTATTRDLTHVVVLADDGVDLDTIPNDRNAVVPGTDTEIDANTVAFRLEPRTLTLEAAEGVLAGLPADTAIDSMADVLGIHEFYSLHVMSLCEGGFAPNATAPVTWRNVTACTAKLAAAQFNATARLDRELAANFEGGCIDPATGKTATSCLRLLGASQSLLDVLNRLPTLSIALAALYLVGATASGIAVLLTALSIVTRSGSRGRETVLANVAAAAAAALALLIAAVVATVVAGNTVQSINRLGKDTVGLAAVAGTQFQSITWAAFALLTLAALFWVRELHLDAKAAASAAAAKKAAKA